MAALDGKTIGVIGLGLMGLPVARNLKAAGARVLVHNRSRPKVEAALAEGLEDGVSPAAMAGSCETLIVIVSDTPAVEAAIEGASGALEGLGEGKLVIDMGTTKVTATRRLAEAVRAKGAGYVDAPVSGGTIGAENGTLTVMAGGSDEDFARAQPILEVLGSRITHVGEVGAGQVAKAANQVIVGLNIGAVAEALALARAAGVDPARVREALQGGFADSRILEVHGERMVTGSYAPGGKCVTQLKDMQQALELAASYGLQMPATGLGAELYEKVIGQGHGDLDHAALVLAIDDDFNEN